MVSSEAEGGARNDSSIRGQCVSPERGHGLCAVPCDSPSGRDSLEAEAVCPGCAAGRGLCGSGIPAGTELFECLSRQVGGRCAAGTGGLRRGGEAAAAGPAAVYRGLCHGGLRTGTGAAGRQPGTGQQRYFLHGCGRKGPAHRHGCGLSCPDGGVPCGGPPRRGRRTASHDRLHRRQVGEADGLA